MPKLKIIFFISIFLLVLLAVLLLFFGGNLKSGVWGEPSQPNDEFILGATITTINATDLISDFPTSYNATISNLNNGLQWTGSADYITPSSSVGVIINASSTITSNLTTNGFINNGNATSTGHFIIGNETDGVRITNDGNTTTLEFY